MEMPVSPSRHAPGLCGGGCALCADVGGFASISRVPAGSLDLPRRHLVRSGGGGTPPPASPPANMSSALPATPSSLGSPLRVSAPSRFIEAPNDCFSDDDEDQEAAFVRELLASAALDPLSAELERMELARAREAASGMRVAVASALSQERQRGESAREQHATVAALAQVPALQRAREEDRAREMRQRARRKAVLDAQSALEDEYMASLQVLESLSAQSTAARKAALLEKQRQQERQLLELQQKQERLQRETERLLEQQRAAAEQERSAAAPAPSSAPAPAAVPAGSSSTTAAPKHDLWAEYRALAESFPSEHAGKLFRIKIPITKALNQVTPEPPVTIAKAKEVVAALQQARSLSDGILRVIQYHFASQLCGMVLPKIATKPSNVFPYAALTAYVVHAQPDLWPLVLAALRDRCIYLVPRFIDRRKNEPEQSYKLRLGCDGDSTFIREQNGYTTFFAALCCAQVSSDANLRVSIPRLGELWTVLSGLLNERPMFLSPDLITCILETAGVELTAVYGRQMHKLLAYIHRVYLPMCQDANQTRDQLVDKPLVLRLAELCANCARTNYQRIPDVDAAIWPDFVATKRAFQMRPI